MGLATQEGALRAGTGGRSWNDKLNAHMENVGYAATVKDQAVYVKGSWSSDDFVAGGFWVDDSSVLGRVGNLEH